MLLSCTYGKKTYKDGEFAKVRISLLGLPFSELCLAEEMAVVTPTGTGITTV